MTRRTPAGNTLFYGDNIAILREYIENVSPQWIRALGSVVEGEGAKIGILVTLTDPTTTMRRVASAAGFYKTEYGSFEKIQILTVEDLFDGRRPHTPWVDPSVFKKAKRENTVTQGDLGL
jgi:site-specific DNA-methyltransferase (adenine-specific)